MRYERNGWSGKCGVYMITSKTTSKSYIGSSVNISGRISQHFGTAMRKYKDINEFYADISKYGRDDFKCEVLEFCEPEEKLERERYWFYKLQPGYNQIEPDDQPFKNPIVRKKSSESCHTEKGTRNRINAHNTDEYIRKAKERVRYKMISCYGVSETGERTPTFESISDAARWIKGDRIQSTINNISEVIRGKSKTAYGYVWKRVI